jgi:outer membrane protein TolC
MEHDDLWVEEVVLKVDDRPGEYQVILDFWSLDSAHTATNKKGVPSSDPQPAAKSTPEPNVVSVLSPGERLPVRTDIVLCPDGQAKENTEAKPKKAHITGFRVGEHPEYTRVVVEARGQEPVSVPDVVNGSLRIRFEQLELLLPESIMKKKMRPPLLGLQIQPNCLCLDLQAGTRTRNVVILDSDPPHPGAYRLVLDLKKPEKANTGLQSTDPTLEKKKKKSIDARQSRENDTQAFDSKQQKTNATVRTVNIGCIMAGVGPELREILTQARLELAKLLGADYAVHCMPKPDWDLGWDMEEAQAALSSAAEEPGLDMLWAFGPLAVVAASRLHLQSMPVMTVSLWPKDKLITKVSKAAQRGGESIVTVYERGRLKRDLEHMQRLFETKRMCFMLPAGLLHAAPGVEAEIAALGRELQLDLVVRSVSDPVSFVQDEDCISPLYIAPGFNMSLEERKRLFQSLKEKRIFSFSAAGRLDVQAGALAGARPEVRIQMGRRMALNTQELLVGKDSGMLAEGVDTVDRLCINARTAQAVGWDIGLDLSLEAEILHFQSVQNGDGAGLPVLSMKQAMCKAAQTHPDIQTMQAEVESAWAKSGQAAGGLWPQIKAGVRSRQIDSDRAEASLGLVAESRTSGRVSLRQMIFDDSVISTLRSSRHQAKYTEFQAQAESLNVMHRAGKHYWAVIQARTMCQIEKQNLKLIQDNLHMARMRHNAGYSGPEDILRWKTQKTRQQGRLIQAEADMERSWVALNQAMGVDQNIRWELDDNIGQERSSLVHQELSSVLTSGVRAAQVADFAVQVAMVNSPELAALKEVVQAAKIQAESEQRSLYLPTIGLALEFEQVFDEDRPDVGFSPTGQPAAFRPIFEGIESELQDLSDDRDRQEWSAAVELSLPLFQGGRRFYQVQESKAEVRSVRSKYLGARQRIEQQVRSAVHSLSASLPSISLSRKARDQAKEHLEIIQDKYAQGQVSILDLLDAQNEWHVQELRHIVARSAYARDLLDLQRAMAWMEWTKNDEERSRWLNGLRQEITGEG